MRLGTVGVGPTRRLVLLLVVCLATTSCTCVQVRQQTGPAPRWDAELALRLNDAGLVNHTRKVVCAGSMKSGEIAILVGGEFVNGKLVPGYVVVLADHAGTGFSESRRYDLPSGRDCDWAEWDPAGYFFANDGAFLIGPIPESPESKLSVVDLPPIDNGHVLAVCSAPASNEFYALFADLGKDSVTPQEFRLRRFNSSAVTPIHTTILGPVFFDNAFSSSDVRGYIRLQGARIWVFCPGGSVWTVESESKVAKQVLSEENWMEGVEFARRHRWKCVVVGKRVLAGDESSLFSVATRSQRNYPFGLLAGGGIVVCQGESDGVLYAAGRMFYDGAGFTRISLDAGTVDCRPVGRAENLVLEDSEEVVSLTVRGSGAVMLITNFGRIWRILTTGADAVSGE